MHAALRVAFGHFLVEDAAAGGHPLDIAGGHFAFVAERIAVLDGTGEDVGDGLDAAVRVPGETFEVVLRVLVAEVIEEEERIEIFGFAEAEGALEADACSFEGWFSRQDFSNWPE
jgi:NAD(P)H-hydrate repair Nnr-like enzyme with NAD(P)H-hydrate epimerase domain